MDIPARWKSLTVESISRVPFDEWRETVQKARETFFPPISAKVAAWEA